MLILLLRYSFVDTSSKPLEATLMYLSSQQCYGQATAGALRTAQTQPRCERDGYSLSYEYLAKIHNFL